MFQKVDLFPSSGEEGDTYSVGSLRKRQPQSLDTGQNPKPSNSEMLYTIIKTLYNLCFFN
jgi:hypothetical protein